MNVLSLKAIRFYSPEQFLFNCFCHQSTKLGERQISRPHASAEKSALKKMSRISVLAAQGEQSRGSGIRAGSLGWQRVRAELPLPTLRLPGGFKSRCRLVVALRTGLGHGT